jgi:hypothetical protein
VEDLSFDITVAVTKQMAEIPAGCKTAAIQNWIAYCCRRQLEIGSNKFQLVLSWTSQFDTIEREKLNSMA